nr:EAL domain-containing protein [Roseomonas marmotae]
MQLDGVLSAGLDLGRLAEDLGRTGLPPGSRLIVASPSGDVLVDLPDGSLLGQPLPPGLRHLLDDRHAGITEVEDPARQIRQVVGYVPAGAEPGAGFLVAVALDHSTAFAETERRWQQGLLVSLAVLGLTLLAAWWFATRFIRQPLARLVAVAERWRQGDLRARAGLIDHGSEIGHLGRAFDTMTEAVAERERRLSDMLESTTDGVLAADTGWRITFVNARLANRLGRPGLLGRNLWEAFPEIAGTPAGEAFRRAMTERVPAHVFMFHEPSGGYFDLSVFPAVDGGVTSFSRDVTEQVRAEEKLRHMAYHDGLTGLLNRAGLWEFGEKEAATRQPMAALVLDLEGFKNVNDTVGHRAGDDVLREAARRLAGRLDSQGALARLSNDDFAALLPGIGGPEEAVAAARALQSAIVAEPFQAGGRVFHLTCSAGLAFGAAASGAAFDMLLSDADLANQRAKAAGGSQCLLFDSSIRAEYEGRRLLAEEIGRAAREGEFELHYQPQIRLADGALVGAEALLRWRHPLRGLLPPAAFLEALEASPQAVAVGDWIIDEACRQASEWRRAGLELRIGVNLFGGQLRAGDLAGRIGAALARRGLPPEALELELTENIALRQDEEVLRPLRSLRERGIGIALDDFGTGFASLTTLKNFPLTHIKIDRSFISNITGNTHDLAIVEAVLTLGRRLGLQVIAEGVETAEQEAILAAHGCAEGQGYRYGRPMPAGEFLEWRGVE